MPAHKDRIKTAWVRAVREESVGCRGRRERDRRAGFELRRHASSFASMLRVEAICGSECSSLSAVSQSATDFFACSNASGIDVVLFSASARNALPKYVMSESRAAAERGAVFARGRDDHRRIVAQRIDEAAGIARVDDDDFPADAGLRLQRIGEIVRLDLVERQRIEIDKELVIVRSVRRDVEQQQVFGRIHFLRDVVERPGQVGQRRQRPRLDRRRVVFEHEHAAFGVEALPNSFSAYSASLRNTSSSASPANATT